MERAVDFGGEKVVKSSVLDISGESKPHFGAFKGINPEKEAKYGLQVD